MSADPDDILRGRAEELARASAGRGCFMFTDFLTTAQQSLLLCLQGSLPVQTFFFGGYECAERVMARFGSPQELGYEEPFPIIILKISPLNARFSDRLTHRDFLGALLNLGIERRLIGDILTDGTCACVFASARIAPFIEESLTRVKHTPVSVAKADAVPAGFIRAPEEVSVVVSSLRLDAVISRVYNLSRKEVQALLAAEKIFINSRVQTRPAYMIKENDLISVRGRGRFRFKMAAAQTRKGNLRILIDKY